MKSRVAEQSLVAVPLSETWISKIVVFLGYIVVAVIFTWPLVLHGRSAVIQKGSVPVDAGQGLWNLWWTRQAIFQGTNPYITHYIFYPEKINLFWQTLSLPNTILSLPVLTILGPISAFNTLGILSFGLSGYFTYRITNGIVNNRVASLIAGFIFAFSSFHMQVLLGGPMEIIAIQWIPLYIALLMRVLQSPTSTNTIVAAGSLIVTTLASQYYGLYCVVYTVAHVGLVLLLSSGWKERIRRLLSAIAIGFIWLATLIPFLWPFTALNSAPPEDWYERQVYHSVALIDFLFPNLLHPIWGDSFAARLATMHPYGTENGASLGILAIILIIVGCIRYRKLAWPWLVLLLFTALLAMGPELKIEGEITGIPLLFALLDYIGPFRNSSRPSYFIAVMMLPASILIAYGVQGILTYTRRWQRVVAGLVGLALIAEAWVKPWPLLFVDVAPLYMRLNNDPVPGAVIELPPDTDKSQYMLNQMCHGRPLAGGYLARTPDYPHVKYDSFMQRLWQATEAPPDIFNTPPVAELANLGIRFITLDVERLSFEQLATLREQLTQQGIELYLAEKQVEVYKIEPSAAQPVLLPQTGWYAPETNGERTWRWTSGTATTRLLTASRAAITLSFQATTYDTDRPLSLRLDGMLLGEYMIPAAPFDQTISLSFIIPAGEHQLQLESDTFTTDDGRKLGVSISSITLQSVNLVSPLNRRAIPEVPPTLDQLRVPPCS